MATIAQITQAFPDHDDAHIPGGSVVYGSNESSNSRSPLHNFNFFKGLTSERKTTTKDGQAPKRRGPKPDSKPALTRRQELNRQAQRTHRERKEIYIKALEQEVGRLKELYADIARERDSYAEENRKLRELLAAHNLLHLLDSKLPPSSSGSISGSYPAPSSTTSRTPPPQIRSPHDASAVRGGFGKPREKIDGHPDYEQIGIDFVLAYDNRTPYLTPPHDS